MALAEMGRHDAAFTPICFTVWYEHVGGINPRLSQAIAHQLTVEKRFSDETVERLHREHIAEIDGQTAERISDQFQRVMKNMGDAAHATGETAERFGDELGSFGGALVAQDPAALASLLAAIQAGTERMKASALALKAEVVRGQREIESLRADLERARVDATLCPLSRVLNRKGFDQRLDAMLAAAPSSGRTHGLIMVDIDHFKQVNDRHGHLMGDRVIQALGEVLRASVTQPEAACARYGGEEFAVLLPNTTAGECLQLAESLRARTKAMKVRNRTTNEVLLTVTVSAGVACSRSGEDPSALVARADAALYRSKQDGRDRVTAG
ncbi:GGDEF domain-containing protein [Piscinibacter sakaiensis]|uniref:GGDEF domain-containing protein n=1 Tax=Piscinibacter sakaiensis TaxID=1547922 RepID=UPI001E2A3A20|nr:GGDEF domain-containing protein [Piscinibacter sakaiensis]